MAVRLVPGEFDSVALAFASQAANRHTHALPTWKPRPTPFGEHAMTLPKRSANGLGGISQAGGGLYLRKGLWRRANHCIQRGTIAEGLQCTGHLNSKKHLAGKQLHELRPSQYRTGFSCANHPAHGLLMDDHWLPNEREELEKLWTALRNHGHLSQD